MVLYDKVKNLDKRYSWSFLGLLIGIVGVGYAIYTEYNNRETIDLSFEIVSNTNVLDVNEEVSDLVVNYKNENILQSNRNLKVLTVRISNTGTKHITNFDYDKHQDWGFKIKHGSIVNSPELIAASNLYLEESIANISLDTLGNVLFPKVIIESGEYFTVKVLTISNSSKNPTVLPLGKISGINKLKVFESQLTSKELDFWEKLLIGNFFVHIARIFFYLILISIVFIGFGIPLTKVSDYIESHEDKRKIEKFKKNTSLEIDDNVTKVFVLFTNYKKSFLLKAQNILSKKETLENLLRVISAQQEKFDVIKEEIPELFVPYNGNYFIGEAGRIYPLDFIITKLKEFGAIEKKGDNYKVNEKFVKPLNEFIYFLNVQ